MAKVVVRFEEPLWLDAGTGQQQLVGHLAEQQTGGKAGIGATVGRRSTRPSVLVNSRLVTGWGATTLTGPASESVISA